MSLQMPSMFVISPEKMTIKEGMTEDQIRIASSWHMINAVIVGYQKFQVDGMLLHETCRRLYETGVYFENRLNS